ncbi:MAG: SGNH/GDSL hydrolase family protein [Planctomycetota bacterium]
MGEPQDKLRWIDALSLTLEGRGWDADALAHRYDRLPAHAEHAASEAVWRQARQTTGFAVRFETDAAQIHARAILRRPPDNPDQYIKWLDLYARDGDVWRYAATSTHGFVPSGRTPIIANLSGRRTFLLNLPLTYSLERIEIGVPPEATVTAAPAGSTRPVAVYGTSVVRGSSASRPGMTYPAILRRRLDRPVLNLGFSGAARCEPPLGRILAELDPAVYVIDPIPNMNLATIETNAEPFLRELLAARPTTPVLMVGARRHAHHWIAPGYLERWKREDDRWRALHEKLAAEADAPWRYVDGATLLGADCDDTVDGSHPSDLGFHRMADAIEPDLRALLRASDRDSAATTSAPDRRDAN